jgi:hypothetical protein
MADCALSPTARRRRSIGGPMAAAGPGPLPVRHWPRRPAADSGRADGRTRRTQRGPILQPLPRDHVWPDHDCHLAPLRHSASGQPHLCARWRTHHRARIARRAGGRRRPLRQMYELQAARFGGGTNGRRSSPAGR